LTLQRKPRSGLLFVARIERVWSSKISSRCSGTSSKYSTSVDAQGFGGLETETGRTGPQPIRNTCSGPASRARGARRAETESGHHEHQAEHDLHGARTRRALRVAEQERRGSGNGAEQRACEGGLLHRRTSGLEVSELALQSSHAAHERSDLIRDHRA